MPDRQLYIMLATVEIGRGKLDAALSMAIEGCQSIDDETSREALFPDLVKDGSNSTHAACACFIGQPLVDWLERTRSQWPEGSYARWFPVSSREEGLALLQHVRQDNGFTRTGKRPELPELRSQDSAAR
jgi:hypothetical protein